jgi:hypothetical protein
VLGIASAWWLTSMCQSSLGLVARIPSFGVAHGADFLGRELRRRSGSPGAWELERFGSRSPGIKGLRDLFVMRDRTPVETTNTSGAHHARS